METYISEEMLKEHEPELEDEGPTLEDFRNFVNTDFRQILYIFNESSVGQLALKDTESDIGISLKRKKELPSLVVAEQDVREEEDLSRFKPVTSKYLGIFHLKSKAGQPFVKIGDFVKKGQVLATVETLNIRNEIKADRNGIIVEVFEQEDRPVEYGQILFLIDPSNLPPGGRVS